jgi:hypothetical protein
MLRRLQHWWISARDQTRQVSAFRATHSVPNTYVTFSNRPFRLRISAQYSTTELVNRRHRHANLIFVARDGVFRRPYDELSAGFIFAMLVVTYQFSWVLPLSLDHVCD